VTPAAPPTPLDLLTDALARGRLSLAEAVGLSALELDALFDAAVGRLEAGRTQEAAEVLAGLLTLFPYAAKYWRALGIALQRDRSFARARAAYDVALGLAPRDPYALCYRGETLLYLGDTAAARRDLEAALPLATGDLATRARQLLGCLGALHSWKPNRAERNFARPNAPTPSAPARLMTTATAALPLTDSLFALDEHAGAGTSALSPEEVTATCKVLIAPFAAAAATGAAQEGTTQTSKVAKKPTAITKTALLPGRGRRAAAPEGAVGAPEGAAADPALRRDADPETTHTAIVRRRLGLALDEDV